MSVEVILKKSLIGASKRQIAIASSLGLKRIGDKVLQKKNGATMGKLAKIAHLLDVIEK